ncbi:hypothetical protein [Pseudoduganella aquatica]|uniref:hypothetical protein n=1 Tax=Pseudoduganella aquatica TaxID=2660641 RepID=UPI001E2B73A4|nr:hypothetical protein [Pseudoduganella aquatica]
MAQIESGPQLTKMLFLRNAGRNNNVSLFQLRDIARAGLAAVAAGPGAGIAQ